jgi:L-ascorbate metabolism protein UlaG (beta-lactamase superfamily)
MSHTAHLLRVVTCWLIPLSAANSQLRLTHFGTAAWEITDGKTVVLIDPYLSRMKVKIPYFDVSPDDPRTIVTDSDILVPDERLIDAHIKRADFILITHTHSDHLMDTPYIARKTGALVIGTESTTNFARANGVPNSQLMTVKGGEDLDLKTCSVRVIPSLHGSHREAPFAPNLKGDFSPPRPTSFGPEVKAPFRVGVKVEGGTLAYLLRLGSLELLAFGSMNYIEREVDGLRPDVALIGALQDRINVYHYTERLLRALGYPRLVLPTHWDRFNVPYELSQKPAIDELQSFIAEVKSASPATKVIVPEYFKPIDVAGRGDAKTRK